MCAGEDRPYEAHFPNVLPNSCRTQTNNLSNFDIRKALGVLATDCREPFLPRAVLEGAMAGKPSLLEDVAGCAFRGMDLFGYVFRQHARGVQCDNLLVALSNPLLAQV
ncbi:hypothetical protein [Acetobacter sp.]|uniref:hypothetical protein n=1 Tax=Acetobacter sp. TaxID=440 RepID=UPI0039E7469A